MVGIEPTSKKKPLKTSTGVDCCLSQRGQQSNLSRYDFGRKEHCPAPDQWLCHLVAPTRGGGEEWCVTDALTGLSPSKFRQGKIC